MSLRVLAVLGTGIVSTVVLLVAVGAVGITATLGGRANALLPAGAAAPGAAAQKMPRVYLEAFESAASSCPGLSWSVLAGIGRVESDFGLDTRTSSAGAEVIYRWDEGLRHQRDEAVDGRGSLVSEGSLARGQGGGHGGFPVSPAHDDQISSVASGVSI